MLRIWRGFILEFVDVLNRIVDMLHSPEGETALSATGLTIGMVNPEIGSILGVAGNFL